MVCVEPAPVVPDAVSTPWGGAARVTFGPADEVRALRIDGRVAQAAAVGRDALSAPSWSAVERAAVLTELAAALVELADPLAPQVVADALDACLALPDTPDSTFLLGLATGTAAATSRTLPLVAAVDEVLTRASAWGLRDVQARVANTLGCLLWTTDPEAAQDAFERSRVASAALVDQDPTLMVRWFINAADVLGASGRFEDAAALALEGLDLATEHGLRAAAGAHLAATAVENLVADGELLLARATLHPWLPRGEVGRDRWWLVALDGRLALLRGDREHGAACARALDRDAPADLPAPAEASRALLRAELCAQDGSVERAVMVALDGAARVAGERPVATLELLALAADAAAHAGPAGARRRSWNLVQAAWDARPSLHDDHTAPWWAVVEASGAELRGEDALELWRRAEVAGDGRLPVAWTVRVALSCARAHARNGSVEAARRHAARARRIVAEHGLLGFDRTTRTVEDDVVVPALHAPLTPREVQVMRLLTAGAANREIAHSLVLSPRTVEVHVASILRKLGVASRTAAVARSRALGLSDAHEAP